MEPIQTPALSAGDGTQPPVISAPPTKSGRKPAATVPSGSTIKVEAAPAAAEEGPTRRVIAVATLQGGTPADPEEVPPGRSTLLTEKEARRLVDLGLARWPGEAANVASEYDEAIKDTTAKTGEGKADEADDRADED